MKRHAITALAVLLALSACSAEAEPKTEPTPSTTPSPTATPIEEPLHTTPEAAIQDFFTAVAALQADPSDTSYRRMWIDTCTSCAKLEESIEAVHASGGSFSANQTRVTEMTEQSPGEFEKGAAVVSVVTEAPPSWVIMAAGAELKTYQGGEQGHLFTLRESGAGWLVAAWKVFPQ